MNKQLILLIIIIILVFLFFYFNQYESFLNSSPINNITVSTYETKPIPPPTYGTQNLVPTLDTTGGVKAVQMHDQYNLLNDPLFKDVTYYENDNLGRLGLDMCVQSCNGYCVEYGVTGNAYCFPSNDVTK